MIQSFCVEKHTCNENQTLLLVVDNDGFVITAGLFQNPDDADSTLHMLHTLSIRESSLFLSPGAAITFLSDIGFDIKE